MSTPTSRNHFASIIGAMLSLASSTRIRRRRSASLSPNVWASSVVITVAVRTSRSASFSEDAPRPLLALPGSRAPFAMWCGASTAMSNLTLMSVRICATSSMPLLSFSLIVCALMNGSRITRSILRAAMVRASFAAKAPNSGRPCRSSVISLPLALPSAARYSQPLMSSRRSIPVDAGDAALTRRRNSSRPSSKADDQRSGSAGKRLLACEWRVRSRA